MDYTINTLKGVALEELLSVFNAAFSDYALPVNLDIEDLKMLLLRNNTALELSAGAFNTSGTLVGFTLVGFGRYRDKLTSYIGAMGVIPADRGNKLAMRMFAYVKPLLKKEGVEQLFLEVFETNKMAYDNYLAMGFKLDRTLYCYRGDIAQFSYDGAIEVRLLVDQDWSLFESFWRVYPSWQNSTAAAQMLIDYLYFYGAYSEGQLVGYLAYNPKSKQVIQLAVAPAFRRQGVAKALIHHIMLNHSRELTVVNIASEAADLQHFFEGLGLQKFITQSELTQLVN